MALGASRVNVLGLVAKDAFLLVSIGLAVGFPLTMAVGRLLNSHLYGIGSFDPRIILGSLLALVLSAAAAVLLPASRAALMSPINALRRD